MKFSQRPSIIFVHLNDDFSGSPKVLSQVIDTLDRSKFFDRIFVYAGSNSSDGFLSKFLNKNTMYFYRRSKYKILTLFYLIISQLILAIKLLRYRNDNVYIYVNAMLPFGAAIAGRLMKKKVIYHIHETSIKPNALKFFLRLIVKLTADKVIYVSDFLKEAERFDDIEDSIIHNSLDADFINNAVLNKYSINEDYFNVMMACSLKDYKGIPELLKIAEKCQDFPKIRFFLILNASQEEVNEYFSIIDLPKNLNIYSSQSDLDKFYGNANLLLNLSRPDSWIETFGLTILEGMAYGVPAIVPPAGGPIEIVRDGIDGYHILSSDYESISNQIKNLSQDPSLCNTLSKSARARSGDFGNDNFRKQITAFITN